MVGQTFAAQRFHGVMSADIESEPSYFFLSRETSFGTFRRDFLEEFQEDFLLYFLLEFSGKFPQNVFRYSFGSFLTLFSDCPYYVWRRDNEINTRHNHMQCDIQMMEEGGGREGKRKCASATEARYSTTSYAYTYLHPAPPHQAVAGLLRLHTIAYTC